MTALSAHARPFIDAFYEDSDPTHLLVLSDDLEDKGDKRCSRVRALVELWKTTEGHFALAESDDVYAARNRLREKAGLDGLRSWAFLCVRWLPLHSFAEDGRRLWSLLKDARSREGVVAAELAWCGLIDAEELATKRSVADAADAADAAAYAAAAADAARVKHRAEIAVVVRGSIPWQTIADAIARLA